MRIHLTPWLAILLWRVAMGSFAPFIALLAEIEDPRRAEGKLYRLPQVVLFAILAIVSGANSYRTIHSFIDVHLARFSGNAWHSMAVPGVAVGSDDVMERANYIACHSLPFARASVSVEVLR